MSRISRNKQLLTSIQAARVLGISRETLRRWRLEHRAPPHLLIGKRKYYQHAMLDSWLQSRSLTVST